MRIDTVFFNFELILFYASLISGLICLVDFCCFAGKRQRVAGAVNIPILVDYARSFFPVLLSVFLLRSFLFEPFRIPTGSLQPTLLIGDFVLVNKFRYGIRLPVIHKKIYPLSEPKRGDIIVLRWPPNPSINFIKRVVGLPGDHIDYINKVLYINGKAALQTPLNTHEIFQHSHQGTHALSGKTSYLFMENLLGVPHQIYLDPTVPARDYRDIIVPDNMYFVMGDNRDDSADSRYWGFVPEEAIVGQAVIIWMSWDKMTQNVRWNRLIKTIT